jgi:peroxiredoxin
MTLTSANGSTVALGELWRTHTATVLVFWSGECPCVRRYQERVDSLLDRYPADRVRVLGISSNAGESFADVLRAAKERGVRIPIFRDESGHVAQSVGANTTPTAVVIDASGRIRFRGWIDNERLPGEPDRQPWLDRALVGVLEHRDDFASQAPIYGCAITRSLFSSSPCSACSEHN